MASSEPANAATTIPRELTIIPFPEERSWSVPRQVWLRRKSQAHTVLQSDSGKTLQQETGYGKCPSEQNCSNDTGQTDFPDNLIQCGIRLMFCQHAQKIKKRHFHTSDTDIPEKQNDQQSHDHKKRNQIAERSVCFCPGIILFSFICDLMFCSSCITTIVIICTSVRSGSLQLLQNRYVPSPSPVRI